MADRLGPTPEFISLISVKEMNQRNRSLAGGFSIAFVFVFIEQSSVEIGLSRSHFVSVAVAVSRRSRLRADTRPGESCWCKEKKGLGAGDL